MKRILFLSFYFEPDLCAGSFRNTSLANELAQQLGESAEVDVYTTLPNRYETFRQEAQGIEKRNNIIINRIKIPLHRSGLLEQIKSFIVYFFQVNRRIKGKHYDLVFASSSRLFTAFLGSIIARRRGVPFYVDVRDIFYDSLKDILGGRLQGKLVLPLIKYFERYTFRRASHINLISGGFVDYFKVYKNASTSVFTNGIDEDFIGFTPTNSDPDEMPVILYAGNIGEGQGLHKFLPYLAKGLEGRFLFLVVGDGGAKKQLLSEIERLGCSNIRIELPVTRDKLQELYRTSDFYLIHLNDFDAFKKVLPSKVFELGAMDKPIIAGVSGYAETFIRENLSNVILVEPCDYKGCASALSEYTYRKEMRLDFIQKFSRISINQRMSKSIISLLNN